MRSPGEVRPAAGLTPRDLTILEAAASAFHERGFHGVGMDELGSRAGLSGPSLYRHFSGKDEILATLLHRAMDDLMAAIGRPHGDARLDLDHAVRHHVRFALEQSHLVSLHQREIRNLVEPWAGAFARRMSLYTRSWEQLVADLRPTDSPARAAATTQACLGLVFSVAGWPARAREVGDADAVVELVLELVQHGLAHA